MAVSLDTLTADWRGSLDAASEALAATAHCGRVTGLPRTEVARRAQELVDERREVARLLDQIARDAHVRLRHPLSAPRATNHMLGLPTAVRACLFDLDGVLTGSDAVHAAAWRDTFDSFLAERAQEAGHRFAPPAFDHHRDYEGVIHGRPRLDGVRGFLASRGIALPEGSRTDRPGAATVHGLANRKNELFRRRLADAPMEVLRGAGAYLDGAREAGLARAVISPSENTRAILERADLTRFVQVLVDGRTMQKEGLLAKPEPDSLLLACRRLGIEPARAAAFETLPAGVRAARAAEIGYVVGVDRHGREDLAKAGADVVVADLGDLLDPALG